MKYPYSLVAIMGSICIGLSAIAGGTLRTSTGDAPAEHTHGADRPARTTMPEPPHLVEPAAGGPRAELDARAEHEREYRAYMAGVDATFRTEATDPQWSSATSSIIWTALSADGDLRALARGVECRSWTCRVEIADDNPDKLGLLLPMFAQRLGRQLPSVLVDRIANPTGDATLALYMSRGSEAPANSRR